MKNKIGISTQVNNEKDMQFNELFSDIVVDVHESKYHRSHLFNGNELSSKLKEYLYAIWDVTRKEDLIKKFRERMDFKNSSRGGGLQLKIRG